MSSAHVKYFIEQLLDGLRREDPSAIALIKDIFQTYLEAMEGAIEDPTDEGDEGDEQDSANEGSEDTQPDGHFEKKRAL